MEKVINIKFYHLKLQNSPKIYRKTIWINKQNYLYEIIKNHSVLYLFIFSPSYILQTSL